MPKMPLRETKYQILRGSSRGVVYFHLMFCSKKFHPPVCLFP